jgi:hypothetical protein
VSDDNVIVWWFVFLVCFAAISALPLVYGADSRIDEPR